MSSEAFSSPVSPSKIRIRFPALKMGVCSNDAPSQSADSFRTLYPKTKSGLFLGSVVGVPTWISPYPTIAAQDVIDKKTLVASTASTDPTKTQVSWGYPWSTPGATTDGNPLRFSFNTGGYLWQSVFPAFATNGSKVLKLNAGATAIEWAIAYDVPAPSGAGQILLSNGSTGGAYVWTLPSFAASAITSGTLDRNRLPVYQGATAVAAGLAGSVPASLAGDQGKFLSGAGTWTAPSITPDNILGGSAGALIISDGTKGTWGSLNAAQIPSLDANKITTGTFSDARIPSLDAAKITTGTFLASQIPSLDAAKITTGTLAGARIGAFTGATSGVASSLGGVPVAPAGDQGKFLRADATWQALQVSGMLTSSTAGTQALDFSSWNTVSALAISGSITFTFTGLSGGRILTIMLKAASGTQSITWPVGIKWADGLALTAATTSAASVTLVCLGTAATDVYATAIRSYS